MKFESMGKTAILLMLLSVTMFLGACAVQDVSQESLRLESEAEVECARQCEYIHGGTVRGCRGTEAGATRDVGMVSDCIGRAYAELRECYIACDLDGQ
jgi:hypothetical protein